MATRRKFLGILGAGAVSAPLAAKELADGGIRELAGIDKRNHFASSKGISEAADDSDSEHRHVASRKLIANDRDSASSYLRQFGTLPDHVERKLRDESHEVNAIDFDIANKRSWSLAVKVQEQRQRNYTRNLTRYREGNVYADAQKAFETATGFKWPW